MANNKHLVIVCLIVYFFELISVTIFPLPIDHDLIANWRNDSYHPFLYGNNFIPFYFFVDIYHLGLQFYVIRSLGGNLILLLPIGLLFPLLFDKLRNLKRMLLTETCHCRFIFYTMVSLVILFYLCVSPYWSSTPP